MQHTENKSHNKPTGRPPVKGLAGKSADAEIEKSVGAMGRSLDDGVRMLKEWQVFMQAGADLMSDNAKATADDLKKFSACRTTEDFSKASAAFSQSLTTRWLDSGQKLAQLSTDYAAGRFQALTSSANTPHREG